MTIKEVIARENVIITLDDGTEMDSEKTPEELLFILSKGNTIKDLDHDELTKAFVDGCEKDMMKAFVQNYDFWIRTIRKWLLGQRNIRKTIG